MALPADAIDATQLARLRAPDLGPLLTGLGLPPPSRPQVRLWNRAIALNSPLVLERPALRHARRAVVLPASTLGAFGECLSWSATSLAVTANGQVAARVFPARQTSDIRYPASSPARLVWGEPGTLRRPPASPGLFGGDRHRAGADGRDAIGGAGLLAMPDLTALRQGRAPLGSVVTPATWPYGATIRDTLITYARHCATVIADTMLEVLRPADPRPVRPLLAAALGPVLEARACTALADIWTSLDEDALAAMDHLAGRTWRAYNSLIGETPTLTQRRIQAVSSFPMLAESLLDTPALRRAVDAAAPLAGLLHSELGLGSAARRSLHGVPWPDGAPVPPRDLPQVIAALNACDRTWHPRTPAAWSAFVALAHRLAAHDPDPARLREVGPDWEAAAAEWTSDAFIAMQDCRAHLRATLLHGLPRLAAPPDTPPGAEVVDAARRALLHETFGRLSLRRQRAMAARWHRHLDALRRAINGAEEQPLVDLPTRWPGLIERPWRAPNGCVLSALTTTADLAAEGQRMAHCVATYAHTCLTGQRHILHITGPAGEASTAEIILEKDRRLRLRQHRGHRNRDAAAACVDGLTAFLDAAASGAVAVPWEAIEAQQDQFARLWGPALRRSAPGEGRDRFERVLDAYRPVLERPWREMEAEAWFATTRALMESAHDR